MLSPKALVCRLSLFFTVVLAMSFASSLLFCSLIALALTACEEQDKTAFTIQEEEPQDTGYAEDFSYVVDLPWCSTPWVKLPPSSDAVNRARDDYGDAEVWDLLYGDPEATNILPTLVPVVYVTSGEVLGWDVRGEVTRADHLSTVTYRTFEGWTEETQPYTLACR